MSRIAWSHSCQEVKILNIGEEEGMMIEMMKGLIGSSLDNRRWNGGLEETMRKESEVERLASSFPAHGEYCY